MQEKLVRDKIPEIMRSGGIEPRFRSARNDERLPLLLRKLFEETAELQAHPCIDECADVIEVVLAIAAELGASSEQVSAALAAKASTRGGFDKGYVLTIEEAI